MADNTPPPPPDLNYYYIKPTLNVPNIGLILIIIIVFLYLIIHWNYLNSNWENEKCNNANFFLAPLFGKNAADTIQQCSSDIINKGIDDSVKQFNIDNKIQDLSNNITQVLTNIQNAPNDNSKQMSTSMNGAAQILKGIQQNVDNIKSTMTKVLGSVILSSYMSNGIIQSTQNLENTDLVNMLTQYSKAQNSLNTAAVATTMPQVKS